MKKKLTKLRSAYLAGVTQIDLEISDLERKISTLRNDRVATMGALQLIDKLLNPPAAAK